MMLFTKTQNLLKKRKSNIKTHFPIPIYKKACYYFGKVNAGMTRSAMTDRERVKKQKEIIDLEIRKLNQSRGGWANSLPMGGEYQLEILNIIKEKFDRLG